MVSGQDLVDFVFDVHFLLRDNDEVSGRRSFRIHPLVKTTLETGGEDAKIHSERVEKIRKYTPNEWRRFENILETSGEVVVVFQLG